MDFRTFLLPFKAFSCLFDAVSAFGSGFREAFRQETGTLYVVETTKHFTCAESIDLESAPGKALRRLEVGESRRAL